MAQTLYFIYFPVFYYKQYNNYLILFSFNLTDCPRNLNQLKDRRSFHRATKKKKTTGKREIITWVSGQIYHADKNWCFNEAFRSCHHEQTGHLLSLCSIFSTQNNIIVCGLIAHDALSIVAKPPNHLIISSTPCVLKKFYCHVMTYHVIIQQRIIVIKTIYTVAVKNNWNNNFSFYFILSKKKKLQVNFKQVEKFKIIESTVLKRRQWNLYV